MTKTSTIHRVLIVLSVAVVFASTLSLPSLATATGTVRVSVTSMGFQKYRDSYAPSVSGDGGLVAFDTNSSLTASDTNLRSDIYLRSLDTGETTRISVSSNGAQGNGGSFDAAVSGNGRFVAFDSDASNLAHSDTNGLTDVFVRDRALSLTRRISVSTSGHQANGDSYVPTISAAGRYVAFSSYASNLVPSDTNGRSDIFVRDRSGSRTIRASISSAGRQTDRASFDPAISSDGSSVAFDSLANNLVRGDTNGDGDVFVRGLGQGRTVRVSVSSGGAQGNGQSMAPTISGSGELVAFISFATNLVPGDTNGAPDVFVRNLSTGKTSRVSVSSSGAQANRGSFDPVISSDGRFVAFESLATNLVPGDTNGAPDVFIRDLQTNTTARVSLTKDGAQSNGGSFRPSISFDGSVAAFESDGSNLVSGDTNGVRDIFARGPVG